jgi:putative component of membrane protein insertase Oxa1/YidC/SpoIIIJ protein YidD
MAGLLLVCLLAQPLVLLLVSGYQQFISPHKGWHCAYVALHGDASCSAYGKEAIARRGIIVGTRLLRKRFGQCHAAAVVLAASSSGKDCDCCEPVRQALERAVKTLIGETKEAAKKVVDDGTEVIKDTVKTGLDKVEKELDKIGKEICQVPTFSPVPPQTFTNTITVSISCTTSGATICYTTTGTDPTSSSTVCTGPLTFSATTTLKARAFKSGMTDSAVANKDGKKYTKLTPAQIASAITWAKNMIGKTYGPGEDLFEWCQAFVFRAYAKSSNPNLLFRPDPGVGWLSAEAAAAGLNAAANAGTEPPAGAWVYYKGSIPGGHVALAIENGRVIHALTGRDPKDPKKNVTTIREDDWNGEWMKHYGASPIGWAWPGWLH